MTFRYISLAFSSVMEFLPQHCGAMLLTMVKTKGWVGFEFARGIGGGMGGGVGGERGRRGEDKGGV